MQIMIYERSYVTNVEKDHGFESRFPGFKKNHNCLSCVYNCDDHSKPLIFLRSSNNYMIFHIFICISLHSSSSEGILRSSQIAL